MKKDTTTLQALKQLKKLSVSQLDHMNQYVIEGDSFRCFQSYKSLCAIYLKDSHKLILGCDWDYSNTTLKHLYNFIYDYCYLYDIKNALANSKNKKTTIYKLIKEGVVLYDADMR